MKGGRSKKRRERASAPGVPFRCFHLAEARRLAPRRCYQKRLPSVAFSHSRLGGGSSCDSSIAVTEGGAEPWVATPEGVVVSLAKADNHAPGATSRQPRAHELVVMLTTRRRTPFREWLSHEGCLLGNAAELRTPDGFSHRLWRGGAESDLSHTVRIPEAAWTQGGDEQASRDLNPEPAD